MNLEQHFSPEPTFPQRRMDADHRHLDEIRRRTLDRRVGGRSFAECADVEVSVPQLRNVPPPTEDGLHVSMLACEVHHGVEVLTHLTKALEITIDEFTRLGMRDLELSRKRVRALSVDGCEIDGLRARAHLARDHVDRHVEDERGRLAM